MYGIFTYMNGWFWWNIPVTWILWVITYNNCLPTPGTPWKNSSGHDVTKARHLHCSTHRRRTARCIVQCHCCRVLNKCCRDRFDVMFCERKKLWMYMYTIYTWNLFVLYFGVWTLQKKAFSNQNKGHLGSRYIIYYIYIWGSSQTPKDLFNSP